MFIQIKSHIIQVDDISHIWFDSSTVIIYFKSQGNDALIINNMNAQDFTEMKKNLHLGVDKTPLL